MDFVWQQAGQVLQNITNYQFSTEDIPLVLTLILLEGVLSFDNAAILAVMTSKLPKEERAKALTYGLVGAYTFRFLAVIFAAVLLLIPETKIIGGGYLVYLCVSHFWRKKQAQDAAGSAMEVPVFTFLGLSPFWSTVVSVEFADAAFAIDQILVAIAYTDKYLLILVASVFAILALRISAMILTRVLEWFPSLEEIAYLVVGLVGIKLLVSYWGVEVPKTISITLTLGAFLIPIFVKLILDRVKPTS
ncbi:TerC family protein [Candidatus Cyanaurora vandensis]|uniref:TerC family protein n=1 Tax=Candidatus Cyanaurora vandensis TaxID=2714958 RepID=UPI00257B34E7|nr:hypothetical protein [Candidatus Cyanaurora vandensis]